MKFFVNTANLSDIRSLAGNGLPDRAITNPVLILKSGRDFREIIEEIRAVVPSPDPFNTDAGRIRAGTRHEMR